MSRLNVLKCVSFLSFAVVNALVTGYVVGRALDVVGMWAYPDLAAVLWLVLWFGGSYVNASVFELVVGQEWLTLKPDTEVPAEAVNPQREVEPEEDVIELDLSLVQTKGAT